MSFKEELKKLVLQEFGRIDMNDFVKVLDTLTEIFNNNEKGSVISVVKKGPFPMKGDSSDNIEQEIEEILKASSRNEEEKEILKPKSIEEFMKSLLKSVANRPDTDKKVVGDTVQFIDSYMEEYVHSVERDKSIKELEDIDVNEMATMKGIVAETGCEYTFKCSSCDKIHASDIMVYYPELKEKFYVNSRIMKLVE